MAGARGCFAGGGLLDPQRRHAAIQQLRLPVGGDDDVPRAQVAMQDQVLMGVLERRAHAEHKPDALTRAEFTIPAPRIDAVAGHLLHHEIRRAIVGNTAVHEARDPGVIESRQQIGLREEPIGQRGRAPLARQKPERGSRIEPVALTRHVIDHAQAAAADLADNAIRREETAGRPFGDPGPWRGA